jgi:hypothetical protein
MPEEIIKTELARRVGGAGANQIGAATCDILIRIHTELVVVVGTQAAAALCAHAVHRTRSRANWTMPPSTHVTQSSMHALHADLAQRTPTEALSAGQFLLNALVDHLTALIGLPLTRRMLQTALTQAVTAAAPPLPPKDSKNE